MSEPAARSTPSTSALDLSISSDDRLLDMVRVLAVRMAEFVGYRRDEATQVGEAIDRVVQGIMTHAFGGDAGHRIEVHFRTGDSRLEVEICYDAAPGTPAAKTRLERALDARHGQGSTLESIRRTMDRVEFGSNGATHFCRLSRPLPDHE